MDVIIKNLGPFDQCNFDRNAAPSSGGSGLLLF